MSDGSSVRIKVAQYFVNKKLEDLKSNDPQIKINDWTLLQALPQYENAVGAAARQGIDRSTLAANIASQLPPLFPIPDGDGTVSWTDLLKHDKARRTPDGPIGEPAFPPNKPIHPEWFSVAIIGAGVAGLRTAKLLQDLGISYKIFEASDRPGGRIYTQELPSEPKGKHDYYDVGAMRFPQNEANEKTYELFKELGLSSKLIKYVFSRDDNIRSYNGITTTKAVANTAGDHFDDEIVPKEYLYKEHIDLRGEKVFGVNACISAAYDPFRKALIDGFDKGWEELMKYDWASTRSYLAREKPQYPLPVIQWMETRDSGTGGYDRAFSEDILDSLEFDDPRKDVKWSCLEGGTHVLIDAMLGQLDTKPSYGHRVSSVESVYLSPHECFPGLPVLPRFPFIRVSVSGKGEEYFTHVVSTSTFANLATINTEKVPMTYLQRQAIRTLNYSPAVKVAIKFKTRWWEQGGLHQLGGVTNTDRQSRAMVYPSAGLGEEGPGVLMVSYNWQQDAFRFGALIRNHEMGKILDPNRERPESEKVLLEQIYGDLAALHGRDVAWLREETIDYHAFDWYHNPFTMGAYAHFAPGQFSTFFADIVEPAAYGRFHFAGEVASTHHAWVAGALDSAVRVVDEILFWDFPQLHPGFLKDKGRSLVFGDDKSAEAHFLRGLFSKELEEASF